MALCDLPLRVTDLVDCVGSTRGEAYSQRGHEEEQRVKWHWSHGEAGRCTRNHQRWKKQASSKLNQQLKVELLPKVKNEHSAMLCFFVEA